MIALPFYSIDCCSVVGQGVDFTFTGVDNMTACRDVTRELFNFSAHCPYDHCAFNGTYQPPLFQNFVVSQCRLEITTTINTLRVPPFRLSTIRCCLFPAAVSIPCA